MSDSGRNLAIQIAVTALLIPIFTFLNDWFKSRREKSHRFDERRLEIYTAFTRDVSDTLWETDPMKIEECRRRAWTHYEAIILSSSEEVVKACIRVRKTLSDHILKLNDLRDLDDGAKKAQRDAGVRSVYGELEIFHNLARRDMRLAPLDFADINSEITRQYR